MCINIIIIIVIFIAIIMIIKKNIINSDFTLRQGRVKCVMHIKEVLVGFITHYLRVYNIGYGKINKKTGANYEMSINE